MPQVIMLVLAIVCGTTAELAMTFAPDADIAVWTLIIAAIMCAGESLRAPTRGAEKRENSYGRCK